LTSPLSDTLAPARLPQELIDELARTVGSDHLRLAPEERWAYGYDNSRRHALPDAVVLPASHAEVAAVVRLCYLHHVTITARGRGTGTAGGTVPIHGGVVLSLERMNRVLCIDAANRVAVVQPGTSNQALQEAARAHGFFWPPDPTSAAVATIGGNLACNAAGPRAVKYGTPRENTLGLKGVTGTGEGFASGVYTTKGVVGYDLTRLIIGSEGTLAVITEATLRLTPLPEARRMVRAIYRDTGSAAAAVSRIMAQPMVPCAVEFMDRQAIEMIRDYSRADLPVGAGALLMLEVDGPAACLDHAAAAVAQAAGGEGCLELLEARTAEEAALLWETRKALSPALRNVAPKKINEDVVVPVSRMPELVAGLEGLAERYAITIVNFGHAGNGNLHVNLLVDPDDPRQMEAASHCLSEVFDLVLALGGTLSGEHGVGLEKRPFVARELDPVALALMYRIKAQFDPAGILNPGKKLPDPGVS